jgi:hypothetical protein
MKIKASFFFAILLLPGCSDEPVTPTVDFKQYSGIWVPYEITDGNGIISQGPFTSSTIFGVYAESIQLNADKTYVPVIWTDEENYFFKTEERGYVEYSSNEDKLFLKGGPVDLEFEIIRFNNDDLWLKYVGEFFILGGPQAQYKFKRELK